MAFRGWPAEALEFYEGLEADNSKTYWTAHQQVYEEAVRAPMLALLADLEKEFGAGRMYRPYRDVRFSGDKSPYKTAAAASLERGGYVQLSATGLAAGAGMYAMAPDQLTRYRHAVDDGTSGTSLERLVTRIEKAGVTVTGHGTLKTAPRGYPKDHPRIDLLRCKGLITWRDWPVEPWLGTPKAREHVAGFLRTSRPLVAWLDEHVGPSQAPADRPGGRR